MSIKPQVLAAISGAIAASRGFVDQVITPRETRPRLIEALEILSTKRETLPAKKHGNIPV